MKTFYEFQVGTRKFVLKEAPLQINIPKKGWGSHQIAELWDIVGTLDPKIVGKIKGLNLIEISSGPLKYFFLLKGETPVFVVYLTRRLDLGNSWQETIVAKTTSEVSLEDVYKFLNRKMKMFIVSDGEHSKGTEKSWKKMMKTAKFDLVNDETGEKIDVDPKDIWGNSKNSINILIKILKI